MDDVWPEITHYDRPAGGWSPPVGTSAPEDFEHCDAIFCLGQNPGANNPRVRQAVGRGCKIITFNPMLEKLAETDPSYLDLKIQPDGAVSALMGVCKHVLSVDEQRLVDGQPGVIDRRFIARHTHDFGTFAQTVRAAEWDEIERASGLPRANLAQAAEIYVAAERTTAVYGTALRQHTSASGGAGMLANLMLLKGNIGPSWHGGFVI